MPDQNIPTDVFMRSLLKSAKDRGISLVAIYGYIENGKNVMKMTSTEPEEATRNALSWVITAAKIKAPETPETPSTPTGGN